MPQLRSESCTYSDTGVASSDTFLRTAAATINEHKLSVVACACGGQQVEKLCQAAQAGPFGPAPFFQPWRKEGHVPLPTSGCKHLADVADVWSCNPLTSSTTRCTLRTSCFSAAPRTSVKFRYVHLVRFNAFDQLIN